MKKIKYFLCLLLVLTFLAPCAAFAVGGMNADGDNELTVSYTDGKTAIADAYFAIYKVADADAYGNLSVAAEFARYNIDERINSDAAWNELASTLEGYVLRDELTPADSGLTDKFGTIKFPTGGNKLANGLYLVLGSRHEQDGKYYEAQPFMLMLPSYDSSADTWYCRVTASPKSDSEEVPEEPAFVDRRVIKIWNDNGAQTRRPAEITVQLLRNGEVFDEAKLNASNNWRYEWTGLNGVCSWRVVEKVPDGYDVSIEREGELTVITNSVRDDTVPTPTPSQTPGTPNLPQTGQLWWPVPVLAAAGLLLVLIGALMKKAGKHE